MKKQQELKSLKTKLIVDIQTIILTKICPVISLLFSHSFPQKIQSADRSTTLSKHTINVNYFNPRDFLLYVLILKMNENVNKYFLKTDVQVCIMSPPTNY